MGAGPTQRHVRLRGLLRRLQPALEMPAVADWWLMQRADVLAVSNSTFSLTAAMLHAGHHPRFYRADPQAEGFVEFDPWDTLPLLPARAVPANHGARTAHGLGRGGAKRDKGDGA